MVSLQCPVLTEKSWKEEMDNALDTNEGVCGAQDIQRSLERFDAKVKGNANYKVFSTFSWQIANDIVCL